MIEKHASSNLVTSAKREHFFDFFVQSKNCINKSLDILDLLKDVASGEVDEFDELDYLEELKFNDINGIAFYASGAFSAKPMLHVGARDAVTLMNAYNVTVTKYAGFGLMLGDEEHQKLKNTAERIISLLSYLLWFEFDVDVHLEKLAAGEDYIDEIVKMYCDSFMESVESIITFIDTKHKEFPFHLSIFDDYPEYEADFEAIMGPLLGVVSNDDLSIEQVKKVINGNLMPEELIDEMSVQDSSYAPMELF